MDMNAEIERLAKQLDKEDIELARRMTPAQKLRAGGELFDYACRITMAGIKHQHPSFSPEQVMAELRRRVNMPEIVMEHLF